MVLSDIRVSSSCLMRQNVYAFTKALMGWVKGNLPQIETLHYLSDSPTSHYRNSMIFGLMVHHKTSFNIKATWSYFESGHGKGPCDGVGGAVKRSADTADKKGQLIKDAKQFFEWGSEQESTSIRPFLYVDIDMVAAATTELEAMDKFSVPWSFIPLSHQMVCFTHVKRHVLPRVVGLTTSSIQHVKGGRPTIGNLHSRRISCSRNQRTEKGMFMWNMPLGITWQQNTTEACMLGEWPT